MEQKIRQRLAVALMEELRLHGLLPVIASLIESMADNHFQVKMEGVGERDLAREQISHAALAENIRKYV